MSAFSTASPSSSAALHTFTGLYPLFYLLPWFTLFSLLPSSVCVPLTLFISSPPFLLFVSSPTLHRYCTFLRHICLSLFLLHCLFFYASAWGSSGDITTPTVTMVSGGRDSNNHSDQTSISNSFFPPLKHIETNFMNDLFFLLLKCWDTVYFNQTSETEFSSAWLTALCEQTILRRTDLHLVHRPLRQSRWGKEGWAWQIFWLAVGCLLSVTHTKIKTLLEKNKKMNHSGVISMFYLDYNTLHVHGE